MSIIAPENITDESTAAQQSHNTAPAPEPGKRRNYYSFYVFFVLFAATLLYSLDSNEFTSAAPVIARELHLSISTIGLLTSAFTIFLTISIIPVGLWADRARRAHIIGACLAIWSLATTFTALAGSFVGLIGTRIFIGIGEAGYTPAGNSLISDTFRKEQVPKLLSWLALATLIGSVLGMVLGGVFAGLGHGTWRWAFIVTGIPGLILAVCAWYMREPARQQRSKEAQAAQSSATISKEPTKILTRLRSVLRSKVFIALLFYGMLTEFTATALQAYFPTLLQQKDALGMSSSQAAIYAGLAVGPTALVGILVGGYLSSWLRRRYREGNLLVCVISVVFTAPLNVTTLIVMMTTHNLALSTVFLIPSFFFNILHIGPLSAAVLDIAPEDQRASTVAIFLFIVRILGTATAPLVIGMLASSFDPHGLHFQQSMAGHDLITALLITCPVAFVIASCAGIYGLRLMRTNRELVVE